MIEMKSQTAIGESILAARIDGRWKALSEREAQTFRDDGKSA